MTSVESHCGRCLRSAPAPETDAFMHWEALLTEDGSTTVVICPDCITPAEQQAMDADMMDLAAGRDGDTEGGDQ